MCRWGPHFEGRGRPIDRKSKRPTLGLLLGAKGRPLAFCSVRNFDELVLHSVPLLGTLGAAGGLKGCFLRSLGADWAPLWGTIEQFKSKPAIKD